MSRMGNRPIEIPEGVDVSVSNGAVTAKSSEGELSQEILGNIQVSVEEDQIVLDRNDDSKEQKSMHGLMYSLVTNIVQGVSEGFSKTILLEGLGYRARTEGNTIIFELGFSHPIKIEVPDGISVDVPNNTTIKISGIDKQKVGDFAASLRYLRDPDPYNQKGTRYEGEHIRQKVGKAVGGEGAEGAEGGGM